MAVRIEPLAGRVRSERIQFYEPDYGLLQFGSLRDFRQTLEQVGATPFYREHLQGGGPGVDIFRVDAERLGRVRVYGRLTVGDLADSRPFLRAVSRPAARGSAVVRPLPRGHAGLGEEPVPEAGGVELAAAGEAEQSGVQGPSESDSAAGPVQAGGESVIGSGTGSGTGTGAASVVGGEPATRGTFRTLLARLIRRRHVQLEEVHRVAADGRNWAWVRVANETQTVANDTETR